MSKNRKPHKRGEFVPIGDVAWAIGRVCSGTSECC